MAEKKSKNYVREIVLEEGVSATFQDNILTIKGPKGESTRTVKKGIVSVKVEGNKITLETQRYTQRDKKIVGSLFAHIRNMIKGSIDPHIYKLKICSGHFPMNVSINNGKLIIKNFLGEKVPRELQLKNGAEVKVEGDMINVTSSSKELAGQVTADIEQLTRRPGFDTRIFQDGIYMIVKDGKDIK